MIVPERHLADTRSPKRICDYQTDDIAYILAQIADYDEHDSFDAYCVFQYGAIRALRLDGRNSEEFYRMTTMANIHFARIKKDFFEREKRSLGLMTSIDLRNYGESLCQPFFHE